MSELYLPAEELPFKIKFREVYSKSKQFKVVNFFWHIYPSGGAWWASALFYIFQLFLFIPIALIFDLIILIVTGVLWILKGIFIGIGHIFLYLLRKIIDWVGFPLMIGLSLIIFIIIIIVLIGNFPDIQHFLNSLFKDLTNGKI